MSSTGMGGGTRFTSIEEWLGRLGLGRYQQIFADHEIDVAVLPQLTEADLERLGLPLGHRRRVLHAILALGAPSEPTSNTQWATEEERRNLTVVFVDMVDFTTLASQLDPEDLREVMSAFMTSCRDAVAKFGGHVAEYLGDGLVAYFGYPAAYEDAAERAVRAALSAVAAVGGLGQRAGLPLQARSGVATGLVVMGAPFGQGNHDSIATGQTPALAARLQVLAPPGGVVITGSTRELLHGVFALEDLGRQTLKGIAQSTSVWRVLGEAPAQSRFTAAHNSPLTDVVDRTVELALLLDRWQLAQSNGRQLVLLSGEPGIGKSRLVEALREHLADQSYSYVCHQCSPHHQNSALQPVIGWLENAAGIVTGEPLSRSLAKLEVLLAEWESGREAQPILADLLSIAHSDCDASYLRREQTLAMLSRLLTEVTPEQPRLFVLEDAHWIDPTTLELMDRVVRCSRSVPMLMVVTSRPDFRSPWQEEACATDLVLGRLPRRYCEELAQNLIAENHLPPKIREQILDRADGVALFVEELTKAVLETEPTKSPGNDKETDHGRYPVVPSTLQDSLMARLDRLGSVKAVAQAGAALGREFPFKLLAVCVPLGESELRAALDRLVDAELLYVRGNSQETLYTFKHALVRDTAYGSLLRSRRREMHGRIAGAIEANFPSLAENQPELLAHHLTEAGLTESAIAWWSRAGQRELRRSANSEASGDLQRALDLLQTLPTGPQRDRQELELRVQISAPLQVTKGFASAEFEGNITRALSLCEKLDETAPTLPLLWGGCVTSIVRCDLHVALDKTRRFLWMAESANDSDAIVTGHRGLGHVLLASGDVSTAASHFDRALKIYDPRRHEVLVANYALDPLPIMLSQHAMVMQQLGRRSEAAALVAHAWREVRRPGHYGSNVYGGFHVGLFHMIEGDAEAVEEVATELLLLSQHHGGTYWTLQFELLLGWRQAMAGETDAGLERMRRAEAERQRIQARLWTPLYLAEEARLLIECGRACEALRRLETGLSVAEATGQRFAEAELHRLKALALAAEATRMEEAAICLDRAQSVAQSRGARLWEQRAIATRAEVMGLGQI